MWDQMNTGQALLFTIPAFAGSGLFVMKTALMLLGGLGGDLDVRQRHGVGLAGERNRVA